MNNIDQHLRNVTIKQINRDNIPFLIEVIKIIKEKLKKQSLKESGWNKFRDKYFYPILLDIVVFIMKERI